jgi:hypothetical protein
MFSEEIRPLLRQHPFVPFTVHLGDGASHHVHHPDYASLSPLGNLLEVWERDGVTWHLVNVAQITKITRNIPVDPDTVSGTGSRDKP